MKQTKTYPYWFFIPGGFVYLLLFLIPTISSFWFSLTRWDFFTSDFIGLENYIQFLNEPFLIKGIFNTLVFGFLTSFLKSILGLLLAVLLTSGIKGQNYLRVLMFFPVLVSTIGVGITFSEIFHPARGLVNVSISYFGLPTPGWLADPDMALFTVAFVDVWKGIGLATLIYIAGLSTISKDYYEAARIDGATAFQCFMKVTIPLVKPATVTVVTLSLVGGLRSFDLIWAMTGGGPGFSSDVLSSVIYKQYQAGFYGLSTAGNVILFLLVFLVIGPLTYWFNRKD